VDVSNKKRRMKARNHQEAACLEFRGDIRRLQPVRAM
jgi:hypothetical protein